LYNFAKIFINFIEISCKLLDLLIKYNFTLIYFFFNLKRPRGSIEEEKLFNIVIEKLKEPSNLESLETDLR
jgi:hypothetical protein